jgi:hypothetical protein
MDLIELLHVFAGLVMVFFLPGYTLVALLFPRKGELDPEYDIVYRLALGMGLSIVVAIFVGFALNAVSTESQGYVSSGPLWVSLLSLTALFFLIGWLRGAYPWLGMAHPRLYRPPPPRTIAGTKLVPTQMGRESERLLVERESLLRDMEKYAERSSTSNPSKRLYYRSRISQAKERVGEINAELKRIGKRDE